MDSMAQDSGGVGGVAGVEEEGVVNSGAGEATSLVEGSGGSGERGVVQVAEADADGAGDGCSSSKVGIREGDTEWVLKDGRSHSKCVVKKLHEVRIGSKRDAP